MQNKSETIADKTDVAQAKSNASEVEFNKNCIGIPDNFNFNFTKNLNKKSNIDERPKEEKVEFNHENNYNKHDFKKSEEYALRTLKLEPRHFGAFSGLGLIRMALGDWPGAITALESALRIHPNMLRVIRNLKYVRKKLNESTT